jgi:putative flippase GtrA
VSGRGSQMLGQFFRFALVGCVGFLVDCAILYAAIGFLGTGPHLGRVFSYLAAATTTWGLNRRITFGDRRDANPLREWLRFLLYNALGGGVNYLTYAAYLHFGYPNAAAPLIGVALGSCTGLLVNFTLSRQLVFSGDRSLTDSPRTG